MPRVGCARVGRRVYTPFLPRPPVARQIISGCSFAASATASRESKWFHRLRSPPQSSRPQESSACRVSPPSLAFPHVARCSPFPSCCWQGPARSPRYRHSGRTSYWPRPATRTTACPSARRSWPRAFPTTRPSTPTATSRSATPPRAMSTGTSTTTPRATAPRLFCPSGRISCTRRAWT